LLHRRALTSLAGLVLACIGFGAACGTAAGTSEGSGTTGTGVITGAGGGGGSIFGHPTPTSGTGASSGSGGAGGTDGGRAGSGPPYPFVLAHGFFGFQTFAGLNFETYFYGVKAHLAAQGEIVDTPAVDPFNDSDTRGAELLVAVQQFLAQTGAAKVNILGHSQGGLDARVVANLRPDLVASVVTVATPHHGTPIGDIAMKLLSDPNAQGIVDALVNVIGSPLYNTIGQTTSVTKALYLFSQPGITAFNAAHPDSPGIFYASIAGRSNLRFADGDCNADVSLPFVTKYGSTVDPLNALLGAFELPLAGTSLYVNDGLVRAKDARWDQFWGCVPADHLDEIGQILGAPPGIGNDFDHLDFYTQIIAYMRSLGY
jgi:triacylglycerol lipase